MSFGNPLVGNVLLFAFVPFAIGRALYTRTRAAASLGVALALVVLGSGAFWAFMVDIEGTRPSVAISSVVATTCWAVMMWAILERVRAPPHRVLIGAFAFKMATLIEGGVQYVVIEASPEQRDAAVSAVLGLRGIFVGFVYGAILAGVASLADVMPRTLFREHDPLPLPVAPSLP